MAQKHFIQLKLGDRIYKDQVSTTGCSYVADFRAAIKAQFPKQLKGYEANELVLFQPDGNTEIDPETLVTDLKEIPWKPMVVTVEELPIPTAVATAPRIQGTFELKG